MSSYNSSFMAKSVNTRSGVVEFIDGKYSSCFMCNGFYGPHFHQPVCSTCHMFLFPLDINWPDDVAYAEKADSGDSGNEEPNVETDFYAKIDDGQSPHHLCLSQSQLPASAIYHKTDRLAERINNLSHPREYRLERVPDGLIDSLPTEVLLALFRYLDDVSLWNARNVCVRWRNILDAELSQKKWKHFINLRWPLFQPQYNVDCWKTVFTKLLESSTCIYCLESMMLQNVALFLKRTDCAADFYRIEALCTPQTIGEIKLKSVPPVSENSWRHRRLRSELKTLRADPLEGIQATPLDRHCSHWQASITGPHGSPYEGGIFFVYLQIPHTYPMRPPVVRFITKIFHPNISRHGDVGLDSINHNWSLALTISKVLISIQSLLTDPYWYVCMEPDIGHLYRHSRAEFNRTARQWTWRYAMHDFLMPVITTASNSSSWTER